MTTTSSSVRQGFFTWIDAALSRPIPDTTVAFHFNLYEGAKSVHVQLVGTESFDAGANPVSDYWPGTASFTTGEDIFEVPFAIAGANWREWLGKLIEMVNAYITSGAKANLLRASKGVGIGFVDGDMHLLHQSDAA